MAHNFSMNWVGGQGQKWEKMQILNLIEPGHVLSDIKQPIINFLIDQFVLFHTHTHLLLGLKGER